MHCLHPIKIPLSDEQRLKRFNQSNFPPEYRFATHQFVPCGKCEACLTRRRSQWTFRLKQELKDAVSAYFITLTYDEEHLPIHRKSGLAYVSKRDCQNFLKRLRASIYPFKIRYFLVSEYGPNNFRPHYHMILFDFPHELKNKLDEILESAWNNGFIRVDPVNSARIHYVTGYCLDNSLYPKNLDKVFMLCSRRPAIGHRFLYSVGIVDYCSSNETDLLPVEQNGNIFKVKIPRYYADRLFSDDLKQQITFKNNKFFEQSSKDLLHRQSIWLTRHGYEVNYKNLHTPYPSSPYSIELQKKKIFQEKVQKNSKSKKSL